ncbi:MAG: hypothetical protein ACLP05_01265 [Candidatus Kryptoniota bacterium]
MDNSYKRGRYEWHREKKALKKFRGEASENKYGLAPAFGHGTCFICFSEAKKFSAVFSPALIFSLVLSFVSRQKKEHLLQDAYRTALHFCKRIVIVFECVQRAY